MSNNQKVNPMGKPKTIVIGEKDARDLMDKLDQVLSSNRFSNEILNKLDEGIRFVIRRLDVFQRAVDVIDRDRNLLEDLSVNVRALLESSKHLRELQTNNTKDLRSEVNEVKEISEAIPKEVQSAVDNKMEKLIDVVQRKKIQFNLQSPSKILSLLKRVKFW